jgi:hypothetical protein
MVATRSTRIWFRVKVPVLSVQMTVADPIVSQTASCRTRLFDRAIFRIANARERVTLIGNPLGDCHHDHDHPVHEVPQ